MNQQKMAHQVGFELGYQHDYSDLKKMSAKAAAKVLAAQKYNYPPYQEAFMTAYRRGCRRARATHRYTSASIRPVAVIE